jgi:DNA-binding GntR family transcriptional regulator
MPPSAASLSQKPPKPSPTLNPDAHESLAEAVYEAILEQIIHGQLKPGAILSAVGWAEKLQVSRTPVHDALRMLTADGLVESPPGRRAQVADFTKDDLWEIFEMRRLLEGAAAGLAAGRMDGRQLAPLRAEARALTKTKNPTEWTKLWSDFDEHFHEAIAAACGNKRLQRDIDRYRLIHRGFNRISTDYHSLQSAFHEHMEILESLERRDGEAARAAMEKHISNWQRYFVKYFR